MGIFWLHHQAPNPGPPGRKKTTQTVLKTGTQTQGPPRELKRNLLSFCRLE